MPRRAALLAVVAGAGLAVSGCFGPIGVDYSFDPSYAFGRIRRVAIVQPPSNPRFTGLAGVLAQAVANRLSRRYHVYYGNGLAQLVAAGGVSADYGVLRGEMLDGQSLDAALMAKVGRAIGVDAFFFETITSLQQYIENGPTYSTVQVDRGLGYGTVTQNPSSATVTNLRMGARLYDAVTGRVVWSGSKVYVSSQNLAYTGFMPIFRSIDRDFLATIPVVGGAASPTPLRLQPGATRSLLAPRAA